MNEWLFIAVCEDLQLNEYEREQLAGILYPEECEPLPEWLEELIREG